MKDSKKQSEKPLQNATMGGFVRGLNEELEKAGLPLVKKSSQKAQKSGATEFQVTFIKRNKKK